MERRRATRRVCCCRCCPRMWRSSPRPAAHRHIVSSAAIATRPGGQATVKLQTSDQPCISPTLWIGTGVRRCHESRYDSKVAGSHGTARDAPGLENGQRGHLGDGRAHDVVARLQQSAPLRLLRLRSHCCSCHDCKSCRSAHHTLPKTSHTDFRRGFMHVMRMYGWAGD